MQTRVLPREAPAGFFPGGGFPGWWDRLAESERGPGVMPLCLPVHGARSAYRQLLCCGC
jgi:hypothetical protein